MGEKKRWRRFKKNNKQTQITSHQRKEILQKIKNCKKKKTGISCQEILDLTRNTPNFIGCFEQQTISSLTIAQLPIFFMVLVGKVKGHWISVGLFKDSIEIFDPLGFRIFDWPDIPCSLLSFIHTYSRNRKLVISDKVQSNKSTLCGFYCLVYVFNRNRHTLKQIQSYFRSPSVNDYILKTLF